MALNENMKLGEVREKLDSASDERARTIGLTMAVTAVLLAMATGLSSRAHTEEVGLQAERNTQWVNFDSKRMQRTLHEGMAVLSAGLPGGEGKATEFKERARVEREGEPATVDTPAREGTEAIKERALDLDARMKAIQRRGNYYDMAQFFLEISIVLCSISVYVRSSIFWKFSFGVTTAGVVVALLGLISIH